MSGVAVVLLMKIFFKHSRGRLNVDSGSPIDESLAITLEIFRALEPKEGFLGVVLDERFILHILADRTGGARIELLDTSIPAFDLSVTEKSFAENLLRAAAEGRDVFALARNSSYKWEQTDLA